MEDKSTQGGQNVSGEDGWRTQGRTLVHHGLVVYILAPMELKKYKTLYVRRGHTLFMWYERSKCC